MRDEFRGQGTGYRVQGTGDERDEFRVQGTGDERDEFRGQGTGDDFNLEFGIRNSELLRDK